MAPGFVILRIFFEDATLLFTQLFAFFAVLLVVSWLSSPLQAAVNAHGINQQRLGAIVNDPSLTPEAKLIALKTEAQTERELAWVLYQWVTLHFKHDQGMARRIGNPAAHSLDRLFDIGSGSCAVYSNVLHRLFELAGFNVRTVEGTVLHGPGAIRRGKLVTNHVWNQVFLDGRWYVLDATWGAGVLTERGFRQEPNPLFFLMPEELAVLNYYDPADSLGVQAKHGVDANTFSKMAGEALYVKARGFTTEAILSHVKRSGSGELVATFDQPTDAFKVVNAPVGRVLRRGPVHFELQSKAYEEVWAVQGKRWTQLIRRNGVFQLNYDAGHGELLVMGKRPKTDEMEALLGYSVR